MQEQGYESEVVAPKGEATVCAFGSLDAFDP